MLDFVKSAPLDFSDILLSLHLDCFHCTEFSIHSVSCGVVAVSSDFHIVDGSLFQFGNGSCVCSKSNDLLAFAEFGVFCKVCLS